MWEVSHYFLIFTTLAAVLCCSMISTVFMACSDDDDKTSDDKTKPVGAVLYYRMDVSDDMFAALDRTPTASGSASGTSTPTASQQVVPGRGFSL